MIRRTDSSPHFHIQWMGKENLDWECFETPEEARKRAVELSRPGEAFTIKEVSAKCPLPRKQQASAS